MEKLEVLNFNDFYIIISKINGSVISLDKTDYDNKNFLEQCIEEHELLSTNLKQMQYDKSLFKTVFISLHTSSKCNMNCDYCFMEDRLDEDLDWETSKKFIDMIINEYPNCDKYIIDPTGSGEPLLRKELLYKIGEYCKIKSNEKEREVLPMIVTNGTLLDSKTVNDLRNAGILFGVSIDGNRTSNDFYRKDHSGKGVYRRIIKNVKNIKDRSLMGAAVTLTNKNIDIVSTLKHLIKYFPTISIKPVRNLNSNHGIGKDNIEEVKKQYTKMYEFIANKTFAGDTEYLGALLNGDDYFGKFLLRAILGIKVATRCDAGLGRFSLSPDGDIYACPAAIGIKELKVGSIEKGLDMSSINYLYDTMVQRTTCGDCFARFVCGGECMVSSYYISGRVHNKDETMCELKRHLYKLSLLFNEQLKRSKYHNVVMKACIEKTERFNEDKSVTEYLKHNPEVTFVDIKMNRDLYL